MKGLLLWTARGLKKGWILNIPNLICMALSYLHLVSNLTLPHSISRIPYAVPRQPALLLLLRSLLGNSPQSGIAMPCFPAVRLGHAVLLTAQLGCAMLLRSPAWSSHASPQSGLAMPCFCLTCTMWTPCFCLGLQCRVPTYITSHDGWTTCLPNPVNLAPLSSSVLSCTQLQNNFTLPVPL